MSLTINHNLMAINTARNLSTHYGSLGVSTRRLSSGMRIGTAADDAAGLAVREIMRADIASLSQGIRNANDAISMIQVADGALQVIDEKLIRMKELATQAATGTYTSDQRAIIDDEFQAMKLEIYRIARSTDFNGIHLLDGTLSGTHDGSEFESVGNVKVHFGTGNDSAEDFYYISIDQIHDERVNLGGEISSESSWAHQGGTVSAEVIDAQSITEDASDFEVYYHVSSPRQTLGTEGTPLYFRAHGDIPYDYEGFEIQFDPTASFPNKWTITSGVPGSTITTGANAGFTEARITLPNGTLVNGIFNLGIPGVETTVQFNLSSGYSIYNSSGYYPDAIITSISGGQVDVSLDGNSDTDIRVRFLGGSPLRNGYSQFNLQSNYEVREGTLRLYDMNVITQDNAQQVLKEINDSITAKDKIRANLGATQNRLENTISNLEIQAENLQAAESRISDADMAREMTEFVKNQILTQSATAMLAQANSLPEMALELIQGQT